MVTKEVKLEVCGLRAVKEHNGYNFFERDDGTRIAVQQFPSRHIIIPQERSPITLEDPSEVIPTVIELLGTTDQVRAARRELSSFLWKD